MSIETKPETEARTRKGEPLKIQSHPELYFHIINLIKTYDTKTILSDTEQTEMATSLYSFVENATLKYLKGKAEHGGMLSDRDLDKEIDAETYDFFWYNEARKRKK